MKFEDEIIIFDDFIEKDYQEKIKNELFGSREKGTEFPWYYIEDITVAYDDDSKHRPGLSHQYVNLPKEWAEDNDEPLNSLELANYLNSYAETGDEYTKTLKKIIVQNNLKDFDKAKILPLSKNLKENI